MSAHDQVLPTYGSHSEVIAKVEEAMEGIGGRVFSIEKTAFMSVSGISKDRHANVSSLGYIYPRAGRYMDLHVHVMICVEEYAQESREFKDSTIDKPAMPENRKTGVEG